MKPFSFFINAKVAGFQPYNKEKPNHNLVTIEFTKKPPDDLIQILGDLLDFNTNAKRRKEERIIIDEENAKKLTIKQKESRIHIGGKVFPCILKDISCTGINIILAKMKEIEVNAEITVELSFEDFDKHIQLPGNIVRVEKMEKYEDLVSLGIQFDETRIPMAYRNQINNFFK